MFSVGQTSFSGRGNARIKLPFSGHIANKLRRSTILQLNIESLTASKMNVFHHLAMQSEALVILLQETHCTNAEKLVFLNYQLAGSILSGSMALLRLWTNDCDTRFWTNFSIKPFCSLLRETTQVWLLQLCLPSLTESGGIDGPRQFGALTSHTPVEKRGVF